MEKTEFIALSEWWKLHSSRWYSRSKNNNYIPGVVIILFTVAVGIFSFFLEPKDAKIIVHVNYRWAIWRNVTSNYFPTVRHHRHVVNMFSYDKITNLVPSFLLTQQCKSEKIELTMHFFMYGNKIGLRAWMTSSYLILQ